VKRRPAKQIPLSPQQSEGGVDENPRVRAGVKRKPAKQIPLSPQQRKGGVDENPRVRAEFVWKTNINIKLLLSLFFVVFFKLKCKFVTLIIE
jgi:hypothetical protein